MRWVTERRRRRYAELLTGKGLEIGALRNPMVLPRASEVLYSDVLLPDQIDALYPGGRHPDLISDSEHFEGVADEAFDFVVANHVLEHVTDPIGALIEWHRIVKRGGLLLVSLPDMRYTFDHTRTRTALAHLEEDHHATLPAAEKNACHLLEWAEHVEGLVPGSRAFEDWVEEQKRGGFSVHNHVWVLEDVLELLAHVVDRYGLAFELVRWNDTSLLGNELTLLLRRGEDGGRLRLLGPRAAAVAAAPLHAVASRLRRVVGRWVRGRGRFTLPRRFFRRR